MYSPLDKFPEQVTTFLLLVNKARPESPPYMCFDVMELWRVLGHAIVARPPCIPAVDPFHRRRQRQMRTSWGQLLDFLHGSFHRLGWYHYCPIYDRQTKKFNIPGVSNLAFVSVDFQLELTFDEFTDTTHHPFSRLQRTDKDIAIISESAKFKPPSFKLLIQFIQNYIT